MSVNKLPFLVPFIFGGLSVFSQIKTINSSGDTYTESSNKTVSYWSADVLKIKHSVSLSSERESWLKFNITALPTTYEQVLLKLVKTSGDNGNISITAANPNFSTTATWSNPPLQTDVFQYGGYRSGDTCYLDLTDYFKNNYTNASAVAFKLFTTSVIVSPISFASTEASDISSRPQLLFYSSKKFNIPVFSLYKSINISTEKGTYPANVLSKTASAEERNNYGGWAGAKSSATGFFRVEKDCKSTWHIIDPSGNIFYSAGLNSVEKGGNIALPSTLTQMGINTMGCWSDETIKNMAYTPRFNVITSFNKTSTSISNTYNLTILPVFEASFSSFCTSLAQKELTPYLNDPWVLGYFLDNELPFYKNQLSLSLGLDVNNAQYIEAKKWMTAKYGVNYSISSITADDELEYQAYVAETYFRIVSTAFRSVDPKHMLIGTRFHGAGKYVSQIFEATGKYMDIISINYYGRFEPEEDAMEMWLESGKKPFIITEFYTKGTDSGLGNVDGAGWTVPTQLDRANWFENWALKLLRNKGNVGFHWFRYIDKDGNDANKGVYSTDYVQYQVLASSISKVSTSIYSLRSQILYGNSNYDDVINCNQQLCGTKCTVVLSNDASLETNNRIDFYPNPVSSSLNIPNQNGTELEIYNNFGIKLANFKIEDDNFELNMNEYQSGTYIIHLIKDESVHSYQIIKQN